jgi:predicted AlkP superfamily phosphohydrolase/phosphomutase
MLSDHGFKPLRESLYLNVFLRGEGFLKLKNVPARSYNDIAEGTVAFALDPGRIYLNRRGKYPRGTVSPNDEERILQELMEAFKDLKVDGRKAISRVYHKSEIYRGPYYDQAPDLVLIPAEGIDFKAGIKSTELVRSDVFTGKHTQHNAFLLVYSPNGEELILPHKPSVFDVVPMLKLLKSKEGGSLL